MPGAWVQEASATRTGARLTADQGEETVLHDFHVLAAMDEMLADLISEGTKEGLASARARGRTGGRKPKLSPRQADVARSMSMYDETRDDGTPLHRRRLPTMPSQSPARPSTGTWRRTAPGGNRIRAPARTALPGPGRLVPPRSRSRQRPASPGLRWPALVAVTRRPVGLKRSGSARIPRLSGSTGKAYPPDRSTSAGITRPASPHRVRHRGMRALRRRPNPDRYPHRPAPA